MANDFTGDPNCVALWRFEDGALTVDSIGGNTLTNVNGVVANTVDFMEGAASADFEAGSSQYMSIDDGDLDANFPLKNGDTNKKISICGWFQLESTGNTIGLFSKADPGLGTISLIMRISATGSKLQIYIGYNGGASAEAIYDAGTFAVGRFYHIGFTLQDSDKSWKIVVWDNTAESKIINTSGATTNNISIETAPFGIGVGKFTFGAPENFWDGEIDEVVVFKDILTTGEIDEIRSGTYGAAPGDLSINVFESLSTAESIGPDMPLAGVSKSELISIVENILNRMSIKNLSFETITVQELAQALIEVAPTVFEQMTVTEFISMLIGSGGININDQVSIAESIAAAMDLAGINKFEAVTLTEYINMQVEGVAVELTLTGQEIINISEYVAAQLPLLADQSDSVTIAESIALNLLLSQNQFESMTVSEVVDLILPLAQSVNDSITVDDFVSVVTEQLMIFYENLTVSEYVSVSVAGIVGLLSVTWSAEKPGFEFSAKKSGFEWSAKKPGFIITNK